MPYVGEGRVVRFDADAAVDAVREAAGPELRAVAEYDRQDVNLLFVADVLQSFFDGVDPIEEFAGNVHDYVSHDFYERELFADLFPMSGQAGAFVTTMDDAILVRYLPGGEEGIFVSTTREASVDAVLDALDRTV